VGNWVYDDGGERIARIDAGISYEEYLATVLMSKGLYGTGTDQLVALVKETMIADYHKWAVPFAMQVMRNLCNDTLQEEGNWPEQATFWHYVFAATTSGLLHARVVNEELVASKERHPHFCARLKGGRHMGLSA
jgi:hypothetical protein